MTLNKTDGYLCPNAVIMLPLTWQASALITGVQHMAAAIILAWIALTQMGAYLHLTMGT
jgi:hypothetical protein